MNKEKKASINPFTRGFLNVIGDEKRQSISVPLFALLLSILAGAIVLLCLGKNPLTAFMSFLQGSGILPKPEYAAKKSMLTDFMSMINALTPMIFAALAVAPGARRKTSCVRAEMGHGPMAAAGRRQLE